MKRSILGDVDAVLFDAGFTLLESTQNVVDVYLESARRLGAIVEDEPFRARFQSAWPRLNAEYRSRQPDLRSSEEIERLAWRQFTADLAKPFSTLLAIHDDWFAALMEHYDHPNAWRAVDGAVEVLARLAARGVAIGIVSNWHSAVHGILDHHGIKQHCKAVVTSAEAGRKKPHPEIFELALKRMGVAAERTVHIGDSWEEDVEGARAAGIRAVHFTRSAPRPADCVPEGIAIVSCLRALIA